MEKISKILGQPAGGVGEDIPTLAVAVGNTMNTLTRCCLWPTAGWDDWAASP